MMPDNDLFYFFNGIDSNQYRHVKRSLLIDWIQALSDNSHWTPNPDAEGRYKYRNPPYYLSVAAGKT